MFRHLHGERLKGYCREITILFFSYVCFVHTYIFVQYKYGKTISDYFSRFSNLGNVFSVCF